MDNKDVFTLEIRPGRAANILKQIANECCEDGVKLHEDIGDPPTILDLEAAIRILEKADSGAIKIVDEEDFNG